MCNRTINRTQLCGYARHRSQRTIRSSSVFFIVGAVPLIGYLLPDSQERRFPIAILFTLCTRFAVGAARVLFTRRNWWRSGLEMLVVGVVAAAVAYGIGALLATLTATQSFAAAHV
jgi:VIT1/CCC1 family predicted Fe2+/Mn2+ transporter